LALLRNWLKGEKLVLNKATKKFLRRLAERKKAADLSAPSTHIDNENERLRAENEQLKQDVCSVRVENDKLYATLHSVLGLFRAIQHRWINAGHVPVGATQVSFMERAIEVALVFDPRIEIKGKTLNDVLVAGVVAANKRMRG